MADPPTAIAAPATAAASAEAPGSSSAATPDATPGPSCDSCGATPPCPPELRLLSSHYLRASGCGLVGLRACFPRVPPSKLRPWTEFRTDVLHSVFDNVLDRKISKPPASSTAAESTPESAPETPSDPIPITCEDDFCNVFSTHTLPILKSVIREGGSMLRPDLPVVTMEPAPRHANGSRGQRGPVPDACVIGGSPANGIGSLLIFAAGSITMQYACSSAAIAAVVSAGGEDDEGKDDEKRDGEGKNDKIGKEEKETTMDAIRHVAMAAFTTRARYGFVVTPIEVIIMRFTLDDDDDDDDGHPHDRTTCKTINVDWTTAPWLHTSQENGLSIKLALAFLAFLSMVDTQGVCKRWELRPINGWTRRKEGGYVSVMNPAKTVDEVPACGVLVEE